MDNEQFSSLGERVDFIYQDDVDQELITTEDIETTIARPYAFILFDEILENSPTQSRITIFDPANIPEDQELLESVKKHGIVNPIVVREIGVHQEEVNLFSKNKPGERTYALVAGHRRVAAGRLAGLKGVEGVIAKSTDDHDLITIAENMGRKELSTFEKARAYKSLQERRDLSENETAKLTGISQTTINRLFTALKSPTLFQDLWQAEKISASTITSLKDHWQAFDNLEDPALIEKLETFSRDEAVSLRHQLDAGTPLRIALASLQRPAESSQEIDSIQNQTSRSRRSKASLETKQSPDVPRKSALLRAIKDVFPNVNENKGAAIYEYGIVNGTTDPDLIWAAALYVAHGGKADQAMDLVIKLMSNRKIEGLIKRQVKQAKLAASIYKTARKNKNEIRNYIKTVFL
jgi:ParB/RepB/Spo0J family partition protein